ncbi:SNARE-associated protein Snapin-like [Paramacrobiotus metropolitanus]|uniref:SNARE-associated protein Snapin-like n=1 Tax=Paramacrobiotus metropolitanus TaxID=2943436 RepID=UPI0024464A64|nr:SNARE-associated protein Snapin-like [Paramacrobiotus metropolitanus]
MASKQNSFESAQNEVSNLPYEEKTAENLQDALMNIFRPVIQELDVCVEQTRNSQQDLKRQIDLLSNELYQLSSLCEVSPMLELYAKKMTTIKRRITVMHNILQNVQDRLRKLEQSAVAKNLTSSNNSSSSAASAAASVIPTNPSNPP